MVLLVTPDRYGDFVDELAQMHALRSRVFKERLAWEVEVAAGMEVDSFDALRPTYLLLRGPTGSVSGCVRLLPSVGPNMLRDTFPILLDGQMAPSAPDVWESSRFALEQAHIDQGAQAVARPTYQLFAGMVEFGLCRKLSSIVTVTDVRMERILRRAHWPLKRIGPPRPIGKTKAVAGHLEISDAALGRLRTGGGFRGPVLWEPVMNQAA
jgi:acyl homoserine lactone synthase